MISKRRHCSVIAIVASLLTAGSGYGQDITFRTVALSGNPAPGTSAGVSFANMIFPVINNSGQTAFRAILTGSGVTSGNDAGVWSEGNGIGLSLVLREGDPAPGTPAGVTFVPRFIDSPILNDAGQTASREFITGPGLSSNGEAGIWADGNSGLELVVRQDDPAPGIAGARFSNVIRPPVFNGAGQTAFATFLLGTGVNSTNDASIWSGGSGAGLMLVAREGSPAPDTDPGVNFSSLEPLGVQSLNDSGQTALRASLTGVGVTSSNDVGIWSEGGGGGLALVARSRDAAPGTPAGVNFSDLRDPIINGPGQIAFVGEVTGPGVNDNNNLGIWSEGTGNGLELIARAGRTAPGTGSGVRYFVFSSPFINGTGQTAFLAFLNGTGVNGSNDVGIWSEGSGLGVALVAREGNPAPGTQPGISFSRFDRYIINAGGQVAIAGRLDGTGVDITNDRGIWAEDQAGTLQLIAREGDLLDVDDGPGTDFRTISDISLGGISTGNDDGRPSGMNDLGQLVFRALFDDGSEGVFVSNLVALPEPISILLDIKPGGSANPVNPMSKGVLSVAILSTDEFDVNDVNIDTLLFGDPLLIDNGGTAVSPLRSSLIDISGDGLLDLTLKFSTRDLVEFGALGSDTIEGILTGETFDGIPFEGLDSIRIVPPNRSHGNSLQTSAIPEPTTSVLALAALCLARSRRRSV